MTNVYSQSREDAYRVVVDWNIGNTCSLRCSYCSPAFHSGRSPFPDLDKAKAFVDRLTGDRSSNRVRVFSFTGGEPMEWDHLPEMLTHIRLGGDQTRVLSSAAGPLDRWRRAAQSLSEAHLTYHVDKTALESFLGVLDVLRGDGVVLSVDVAMTPESFDLGLLAAHRIQEDGLHAGLQPLYRDHTSRRHLLPYTEDQLSILFPDRPTGDIVIENHAGATWTDLHTLIHQRKNGFRGMRCGIGIDQYVVDAAGWVWGGWCHSGGPMGNINEDGFRPWTEAIVCPRDVCSNPLDLSVPKWRDTQ